MTTFLRRLSRRDIAQVAELIGYAFESRDLGQDVGSHLTSYADSGQCTSLITQQADFALPVEYWVAEDQGLGQIVAMSGIYRFWWASRSCLWLGWFCVSPTVQHHGLGSAVALQTMAIARARGATVFKVETDRDGTAAQFYEKLGFVREAVISSHYAGDHDAVILTRSLLDIQQADLADSYKLENKA